MKKFFTILFSIIILVACAYYFLPKKVNPVKNGQIVLQPAKITNYDTVQTKLASSRDFPIYRNVSQKGGINAISSTKYFKKGLPSILKKDCCNHSIRRKLRAELTGN
ncbi:hypothetical protein [Lactobacillus intestinalis]|uniref:hypothetical protein n=1 Tax=Lactobacillus intestinalis TaxID=151781 RepID=UPI002665CE3B|nr:hypothetical protein [Lactobacillus intestinalis]